MTTFSRFFPLLFPSSLKQMSETISKIHLIYNRIFYGTVFVVPPCKRWNNIALFCSRGKKRRQQNKTRNTTLLKNRSHEWFHNIIFTSPMIISSTLWPIIYPVHLCAMQQNYTRNKLSSTFSMHRVNFWKPIFLVFFMLHETYNDARKVCKNESGIVFIPTTLHFIWGE